MLSSVLDMLKWTSPVGSWISKSKAWSRGQGCRFRYGGHRYLEDACSRFYVEFSKYPNILFAFNNQIVIRRHCNVHSLSDPSLSLLLFKFKLPFLYNTLKVTCCHKYLFAPSHWTQTNNLLK